MGLTGKCHDRGGRGGRGGGDFFEIEVDGSMYAGNLGNSGAGGYRSKYGKYTRVNHFFAEYQDELIMTHPHVKALKRGLEVVRY